MSKVRIGILGYDGVAAINVVGPLEAFSNALTTEGYPCYDVVLVGCYRDRFVTDTEVTFHSEYSAVQKPEFDTVIIPGGRGMHCDSVVSRVAAWVTRTEPRTRRIASVCSGVYGLATTGLLNGHRVTTHWQNAADVASRFPKIQVEESAIVVKDGKFYSAAGATAGIDLALFLIEEDFGREIAVAVARKLLVYVHRDGGQEQYSEPPQPELRADSNAGSTNTNRFGKLVGWMNKHLAEDLRLDILARRTLLPKHDFIHQFTHTFGVPPGLFVKNLRFNEARRRLMCGEQPTTIARSVGFSHPAYFIQEFRRRFGMLPTDYQRRFGSAGRNEGKQTRNGFTNRSSGVMRKSTGDQRPRITSFTRCIRRHAAVDV